jgi:hypothetical protein
LSDLDSVIEGVVVVSLSKKGSWTKEEMFQALKDDFEIQKKASVLEKQRVSEKRRDAKRLFLEAYLAELEVTGFTNPEEVKQKLKERLSYIEESLFEEFWKETISSEDVLLPVIEKIGDGIENEEVREQFIAMLRSEDLSKIFSFLGEQKEILNLTFSKELLPALRFVLSQMFEKNRQKGFFLDLEAFYSFIEFGKNFPSFTPLIVRFQSQIKEKYLPGFTRNKLHNSVKELLKTYIENLPVLLFKDREIVDRVKKFYFVDLTSEYDIKHKLSIFNKISLSFLRISNKRKMFDETHMTQLIHRAALELFYETTTNIFLKRLVLNCEELNLFSSHEKRDSIFEKLQKDVLVQFSA